MLTFILGECLRKHSAKAWYARSSAVHFLCDMLRDRRVHESFQESEFMHPRAPR